MNTRKRGMLVIRSREIVAHVSPNRCVVDLTLADRGLLALLNRDRLEALRAVLDILLSGDAHVR